MRHRQGAAAGVIAITIALAGTQGASVSGQGRAAAAKMEEKVAKLAWGDPDLQGTWTLTTNTTPLEHPAALAGQEFLTDADVARVEAQQEAMQTQAFTPRAGDPGTFNRFWMEFGTKVQGNRRTSIIIDPPDGRIPPLTPAAQQIDDARAEWMVCSSGAAPSSQLCPADSWLDLDLNDRCLVYEGSGAPLLPFVYNANNQIFQVPGYVVITSEMIHDVRIIPLDGRAHLPATLRRWNGDSRGRWEGDTLIVGCFRHQVLAQRA